MAEEFKINDLVTSKEGSRFNPKTSGKIVGWGKWRHYAGAKVQKEDGTVKLYLLKNLIKRPVHDFLLITKFKTARIKVLDGYIFDAPTSFRNWEKHPLTEVLANFPKSRVVSVG